MDVETAFETCLTKFSPVRAATLFEKVREKGCNLSRAQGYRYGRKLKKAGKLEQINGIWYFNNAKKLKTSTDEEKPIQKVNLWDSLKEDIEKVGGYITKINFERLRLGDKQDPITGWYETFYDKYMIDGIIILRGAKTMQAAAKIFVPPEYHAILLTQALVDEGDRFIWQGRCYKVDKVEEIYDGYVLSYRITKLLCFRL
jgi:hypothetical protein